MKNYFVIFLLLSAFIFLSNSGSQPTNGAGGYTGAPGDGYCGNCHNGSNPNLDGEITITGLPNMVTGGQSYSLTVTITNPNGNASRAGFQIVALDESNANAGEFLNGTGNSIVKTANSKEYFGHQPSTNFPGSNTITFDVDWVPDNSIPADEEITFYGVAVIANGGNGNSNDRVVDVNVTTTIEDTPDPLMAEITNQTMTLCFDSAEGSATVTATGGTMPYSYEWDNGEDQATAISLDGGMHSVTVSDQNNNSVIVDVDIDTPPVLVVIEESNENTSCNGSSDGSVTLIASGGMGSYDYLWSDGNTSPTNSNLPAGFHFCTVSDDNMCEAVIQVDIEEPDPISLMTSIVDDLSCYESNDGQILIEAEGGNGSYVYNWSNGESGNFISNLSAGTYTVEILDALLCSQSFDFEVNQPEEMMVSSIETNASCEGIDNGSSELTITGGVGDMSFVWSNGETTNPATMLSAGDNSVTVTDDNECSVVYELTIESNDEITISVGDKTDILCYGDNTGSISISTTSNEDLTYSWNNGATEMSISDLEAGIYEVIASAANGCESNMLSIEITEPDSIIVETISNMDVECFGESNGAVEIAITGGVEDYSVNWSNGQMGLSVDNLPSGEISAVVTDANNCVTDYSYTVVGPQQLLADIITVNNNCFGDLLGSISLDVTGGTGDITYMWSNGAASSSIENLSAGMYSCEISDENNCVLQITEIEVSEPLELSVMETTTNETNTGAMDGSIELMITGGTPDYTINWSNGEEGFAITNLSSGNYSYEITDAFGCSIDGNVFVSTGGCALTAEYTSTDISCYGAADGMINISIENFTDPVSINWSNDISDQTSIDNLSPGLYSCTITDGVACEFELVDIEIVEPEEIIITVLSITDESEIGAMDGSIEIEISGGIPDYQYEWYNENEEIVGNTLNLNNVGTGDYYLQLSDSNNCKVDSEIITVGVVLSSEELSISDVNIYPNPTSDGFYITAANDKIKDFVIGLYGTDGREILFDSEKRSSEYFISTTDLESGIYLISLTNRKKTVYKKVLVSK